MGRSILVVVSAGAVQNGYGRDPWKTVNRLTPAERVVAAGNMAALVFLGGAKAGGTHGTRWRTIRNTVGVDPATVERPDADGVGVRFIPRVPHPAIVAALESSGFDGSENTAFTVEV